MAKSSNQKQASESGGSSGNGMYFIAYILTFLTGILVYLMAAGNKRQRLHGMQAIILGIIALILWWVPLIGWVISVLIWLYGLYIGFMAYSGNQVAIPYITEILMKNADLH